MNAMLMSVAEPEFIPWIVESEEEAQDLMAKVSAYLAESERCRLCSKIFGLE